MLGIVILNYNEWELSVNCIKSIIENTDIEYRIYVVDNASNIEPIEQFMKIIEDTPNIFFIKNKNNRGYAAGNNIGIKQALNDKCEEVLITNNDIIFSEGCISGLQEVLRENKDIGIVGPKVFLPNGRIQEINMGCKMTLKGKYLYLLRKTPFKKIGKSFLEKFHVENEDLSKPFDVYGVSGCCFMMSYDCVRNLYPLDENTFLYEEENIISHQVEKMGKRIVYYSPLSVIHLGGQSTKKMSLFSYGCFVQSEIYYCRKYLNASRWKLILLYLIRTVMYMRMYRCREITKFFRITLSMFSKRL